MNRSLFSGRYLVITILAIIILTYVAGLWRWQKRDHACLGDDHFYFQTKVQVFEWGSLRLYNFPIMHDCPKLEQYNPADFPK